LERNLSAGKEVSNSLPPTAAIARHPARQARAAGTVGNQYTASGAGAGHVAYPPVSLRAS
jgi:hypothetical protein